jgi:predicted nucleic acid-binding protein
VIDASVALAWCFPDEVSDYADAVLVALNELDAVVPAIWAVEVANALLVGERRKRIRESEILRFGELLKGLTIFEDSPSIPDVLSGILPLARAYNLSAYDAAYVDVALRHNAPIATLDNDLRKAASDKGIKHFNP